ncbi:NAD-dependent histone deacetylase sir2 [Coemansia erecta]|uniref:NAD-dependent histone deacetylase sir2 n=1 Tax=Coemansia erecta TaxID=147472 RepID=A0A9W8CS86_9FUNG|nr:NAD-dependent histone deacetylase sir2 [Coemansia erecta]
MEHRDKTASPPSCPPATATATATKRRERGDSSAAMPPFTTDAAISSGSSSKRHRLETLDQASDHSSDADVIVDGSRAPSPLATHPDTAPSAAHYARLTSEQVAGVRRDAQTLAPTAFMNEYIGERGMDVRAVLEALDMPAALVASVPGFQLGTLLRVQLQRMHGRRPKLAGLNTPQDVVRELRRARRIMVLTGAGVSVSCGIPDFRSPTGIYTRLNDEFGLDDPQQMFDIEYFRDTPELFYSFARELYPYNFTPAPSHAFVKLLEDQGKLLRNYTQNIDTLEHVQGIRNVLNCHGSFATATCIKCGYKCDGKALEPDIMAMRIAYCPRCAEKPQEKAQGGGGGSSGRLADMVFNEEDDDDDEDDLEYGAVRGIMKPDITFFGEKLPDQFDEALLRDREAVDLLLVMGSSLKVAPVSEIMGFLPHSVPQIVINKTPILHLNFDVQLLGDADDIVAYLARECGWELRHVRIAGGSSASAEFAAAGVGPREHPAEPVRVAVRSVRQVGGDGGGGAEGEARVEVVEEEKEYRLPAHWHAFPSAVVTPRDLMVASGDARVRLAAGSSESGDESSDLSGSDEESDLDSEEASDGNEDDEEDEELARELVETNIDGPSTGGTAAPPT